MEWRPIETAPKDGGEGLVGVWVYADAKRRNPRWSSWTTYFDGGDLGCDGEWGDPPTHWMPLPAPPTPDDDTVEIPRIDMTKEVSR